MIIVVKQKKMKIKNNNIDKIIYFFLNNKKYA